jgi:F1F0 ATPase subunit 2
MTDYCSLALAGALLAGVTLGTIFFGGLWWTVRRGAVSPTPTRWFLGSLVLRSAIVVAGFYAVGAGQPLRLGMCLLGFVLARAIVMRTTRPRSTVVAKVGLATAGEPPCA